MFFTNYIYPCNLLFYCCRNQHISHNFLVGEKRIFRVEGGVVGVRCLHFSVGGRGLHVLVFF